jgi:hypothetical protein
MSFEVGIVVVSIVIFRDLSGDLVIIALIELLNARSSK